MPAGGTEEMHKVTKQLLEVEQFRGSSECVVKQALFVRFNLIAMTKLLAARDAAQTRPLISATLAVASFETGSAQTDNEGLQDGWTSIEHP